MIRIAVLADPHLHDVGFGGAAPAPLVRSLGDTLRSTRIFNESHSALRQALEDIAAEGVDLCIIVGDLTDDGQPASWAAVAAMLAEHTARHGTRFFACPGNHDQWGPDGKPLTKGCVDADGRVFSIGGPDADVACAGMRMAGYGETMAHADALGYVRDPRDLHWETPFGTSDRLEDRMAAMTGTGGDTAPVFDASYLVEPVTGLWLLSLDANTYLPDGEGGFRDRSADGWAGALAHKPWLLPWMTDVAARARRLDKRLVAFSHYPAVDAFGGTIDMLDALEHRSDRRRMPSPEVTRALAATGIGLHFSGHWHVCATTADRSGALVNVAVPSTVAFPAGWSLLRLDAEGATLEDRPLDGAPGWDRFHPRYRAEAMAAGGDAPVLDATTYSDFLDRHFRAIVLGRRLTDDWPEAVAPLVTGLTTKDLPGGVGDLPLSEVFVDWYRLRETGGGPAARIPQDRRDLYAALVTGQRDGPDGVLSTFLRTLGCHLNANRDRQRAYSLLRPARRC